MGFPVAIAVIIQMHLAMSVYQEPGNPGFYDVEPYDFHLEYLRDDTALLIDVREYFEYRGSRIKGAINIPSSGNIDFAADTLNKRYALFLYCTTDYRSLRVASRMSELGFRKVYNLKGGIVQWKKDGFPVDKKRPKKRRN